MAINWDYRRFDDLTIVELYKIMQLREQVFVVEQKCAYLDADGLDPDAMHLMGWDEAGALAAYLRVLSPGMKYAEHAIGRVVVNPQNRGTRLGMVLMQEAMQQIALMHGPVPIRLSAQAHLVEKYYGALGFKPASGIYDEDGIPHVEMLLSSAKPAASCKANAHPAP